jgi:hypothetical protein
VTDDELSPAARQGLELANRAIRYIGFYAREGPRMVAESLGLVATATVPSSLYAEMKLPRDTGVRLRITQDRLQLGEMWPRRWWQFWRPRWSLEILAEKPYAIKAGDTFQLMQTGIFYTVVVNDNEVLRYPPIPENEETCS